MCFGIGSIVTAITFFLYSILLASIDDEYALLMLILDMFPLAISIVATALSSASLNKGFDSGMPKAGKALGIVSIVLTGIAMFICLSST